MMTLQQCLNRLADFVESNGIVPRVQQVGLVEVRPGTAVDERGRFRVQKSEVRSVRSYAHQFQQLLNDGLPWINLSQAGVVDGVLIVLVEFPRPGPTRSPRTSVNYSGPTQSVLDSEWSLDSILVIE